MGRDRAPPSRRCLALGFVLGAFASPSRFASPRRFAFAFALRASRTRAGASPSARLPASAASIGLPRMLAGRRGPLDAAPAPPKALRRTRLRRFRRRLGRRRRRLRAGPAGLLWRVGRQGVVGVGGHAACTPRSRRRAPRGDTSRAHTRQEGCRPSLLPFTAEQVLAPAPQSTSPAPAPQGSRSRRRQSAASPRGHPSDLEHGKRLPPTASSIKIFPCPTAHRPGQSFALSEPSPTARAESKHARGDTSRARTRRELPPTASPDQDRFPRPAALPAPTEIASPCSIARRSQPFVLSELSPKAIA